MSITNSVQNAINMGATITGNLLGVPCAWYRPVPLSPLCSTTYQGMLNAYFDVKSDFKATTPSKYAHPQWFASVDRTNLKTGDYLVTPSNTTYFVNILEAFTATGVIQTNGSVSIYRVGKQPVGNGYYAGNPTGLGAILVQNLPVSILQGTKGEADNTGVINEPRQPWVAIIMPDLGVDFDVGDVVLDDQNRRYLLSSIEKTSIGIRCTGDYSGS